MLIAVLNILIPVTFVAFQIAELIRPARRLPNVKRWRLKGFVYFAMMGVLSTNIASLVPMMFGDASLLDTSSLGLVMALPAFLVVNLAMYALHRLRHAEPLWRFHQLHHAGERLDAASASMFHPLDAAPALLLSTAVTTALFGVSREAAALVGFLGFFCSVFQHANIRTARWIGWFIQRPEQHSVHHARGTHAFNYANVPLIDVLFGTHRNPDDFEPQTGFFDGASAQNLRLWLGLDATRSGAPVGARGFITGAVSAAMMVGVLAGAGALTMRSRAIAEANRPKIDAVGERGPLLDEALHLPNAQAYRAHWLAQANPLMGPTSLANAMRSWGDQMGGVDVTEPMLLDGTGKCAPLGKCFGGLSLDDVAELARTKMAQTNVTVVRNVDLATFRATVARANDPSVRVLANFHVGTLEGSDQPGHHSPVAGYLAEHDMVLIIDTNAARGSFLVTTEQLWKACNAVDSSTGQSRGLVILQKERSLR
jgi:sterol desaturase/sphingolipid hydroxylase (fatty acid hydroxylase superfamily)